MYDCQSLQYNYKFHVMPLTYHRPPFHVNVFKLNLLSDVFTYICFRMYKEEEVRTCADFDMEVGGMGYSYCHTSFSTFFCRPSFSTLLLRR